MSLFIPLAVAARIKFKSLMLAYRIAYSTTPNFLNSLIHVHDPSLSLLLGTYMSLNAMWHLCQVELSVKGFFHKELPLIYCVSDFICFVCRFTQMHLLNE